ncbi:UNVERIFIED_CONTAM: putative polygalacturonase [Sesamum radiatum]|uniref:Polygalacturonase n=1 Tax=Sesamum radiatum TaxID=300843 RepID=A0AAW2KEB4_SESRA
MKTSIKGQNQGCRGVLGLFCSGILCLNVVESRDIDHRKDQIQYSAINCRKHTAVLTDFGGIGDGKTLNTAAFKAAIANLSKFASDGGAQLVVPPEGG